MTIDDYSRNDSQPSTSTKWVRTCHRNIKYSVEISIIILDPPPIGMEGATVDDSFTNS